MACADQSLLGELKGIIGELECCNTPPCVCPKMPLPFAQCCMVCPPPILAPTCPQPVKPLQLPCPGPVCEQEMSPQEAEKTRYANFYNNYNIDYHPDSPSCCPSMDKRNKRKGVTTDGKTPICCDKKKPPPCGDKGCPTGFKPCTMKMTPPPGCHPCGVWCAQIQPCPPKPKRVSGFYEPKPCRRPCCKHWKPKEGPCKYDGICKAHCYEIPAPKRVC